MTPESFKRLVQVVDKELPIEELTYAELRELERQVDRIVAERVRNGFAPGSKLIQ